MNKSLNDLFGPRIDGPHQGNSREKVSDSIHHPFAHKICRDQADEKDDCNAEDETQPGNVKGKIGIGIISEREKTEKPVRQANHDLQDIDTKGNGDEDEQSR